MRASAIFFGAMVDLVVLFVMVEHGFLWIRGVTCTEVYDRYV